MKQFIDLMTRNKGRVLTREGARSLNRVVTKGTMSLTPTGQKRREKKGKEISQYGKLYYCFLVIRTIRTLIKVSHKILTSFSNGRPSKIRVVDVILQQSRPIEGSKDGFPEVPSFGESENEVVLRFCTYFAKAFLISGEADIFL